MLLNYWDPCVCLFCIMAWKPFHLVSLCFDVWTMSYIVPLQESLHIMIEVWLRMFVTSVRLAPSSLFMLRGGRSSLLSFSVKCFRFHMPCTTSWVLKINCYFSSIVDFFLFFFPFLFCVDACVGVCAWFLSLYLLVCLLVNKRFSLELYLCFCSYSGDCI